MAGKKSDCPTEKIGENSSSDEVEKQEEVQLKPVSFPVTCVTKEGSKVVVSSHILSQSKVFKNMCDELGLFDRIPAGEELIFPGEFPLDNITERVFLKVVEWCEHHVDVPDPVVEQDANTYERIHFTYTDFEEQFLDVGIRPLQALLLAANFLDIYSLYILGCQRAAEMWSGKSPAQLRKEWGFADDLSEVEKQEIRQKYSWAYK